MQGWNKKSEKIKVNRNNITINGERKEHKGITASGSF
jgi:HSP20 family molecular chaperone IbpA